MVTVKHSGYKDLELPVNVARGLTTSADFVLEVDPYQFTGFDAPVDMPTKANLNITNIGTAGKNIPLKWHLSDGKGVDVSTSDKFNLVLDLQKTCTQGLTDEIEVYDPATTTPGLSYQGNGNWHYNWKTTKTVSFIGQCYKVYLVFDNQEISPIAQFRFKS